MVSNDSSDILSVTWLVAIGHRRRQGSSREPRPGAHMQAGQLCIPLGEGRRPAIEEAARGGDPLPGEEPSPSAKSTRRNIPIFLGVSTLRKCQY
jgi:hypothetical protein